MATGDSYTAASVLAVREANGDADGRAMRQQAPRMAGSMKKQQPLWSRLDRAEWRRRLWHMAPGLLPFVLWAVPHADPISPTLRGIMLLAAAGIGGGIYIGYRRIERNGETGQRLWSVAGYAGSVLATLLLFPQHAERGLTVLAVLAWGDGSATLGGKLIGGPTLPWNRSKTAAGMVCFLAIGSLMATLAFWGESANLEAATPGIALSTAFACGTATAIAAAFAESIPSAINDNVRVGLTAAVTISIAHAIVLS